MREPYKVRWIEVGRRLRRGGCEVGSESRADGLLIDGVRCTESVVSSTRCMQDSRQCHKSFDGSKRKCTVAPTLLPEIARKEATGRKLDTAPLISSRRTAWS